MNAADIPNGIYQIHAFGSDAVAIKIVNGRVVGRMEECLLSNHRTANDRRADWLTDNPADLTALDSDTSDAVAAIEDLHAADCVIYRVAAGWDA
jgi:hypothetical protein